MTREMYKGSSFRFKRMATDQAYIEVDWDGQELRIRTFPNALVLRPLLTNGVVITQDPDPTEAE